MPFYTSRVRNKMYVLQFVAVMLSTALADVCWTYYFLRVSEHRALAAGWWSALVVAFGAVVTVSYVHDNTLLIAGIFGAFLGTSVTVWFNKRSK